MAEPAGAARVVKHHPRDDASLPCLDQYLPGAWRQLPSWSVPRPEPVAAISRRCPSPPSAPPRKKSPPGMLLPTAWGALRWPAVRVRRAGAAARRRARQQHLVAPGRVPGRSASPGASGGTGARCEPASVDVLGRHRPGSADFAAIGANLERTGAVQLGQVGSCTAPIDVPARRRRLRHPVAAPTPIDPVTRRKTIVAGTCPAGPSSCGTVPA